MKKQEIIAEITGISTKDLVSGSEKFNFNIPYPVVKDRERKLMQSLEILAIQCAADAIELILDDKDFQKPSVYSILTAGMDVPEDAVLLGHYGSGAFESFPPTDIHGHAGEVYAVEIGPEKEQTMLILKGRAHPYEWSKDEYGDMVLAHPLQVMKEMVRRQRAQDGVDPVFILTYLTGVREGQEMGVGELAVVLDDTATDNDTHPGQGPRALLDKYTGERFQAKDGRASSVKIAQEFLKFMEKNKRKLYPAASVGTPGTTEFQSSVEARSFDGAFQSALKDGNFGQTVEEMFADKNLAALLFCMGISAELATLRQVFPEEADFQVLALALATDIVGGKQSKEINHNEVVATALKKGSEHQDSIMAFVNSPDFNSLIQLNNQSLDHSIEKKRQ